MMGNASEMKPYTSLKVAGSARSTLMVVCWASEAPSSRGYTFMTPVVTPWKRPTST